MGTSCHKDICNFFLLTASGKGVQFQGGVLLEATQRTSNYLTSWMISVFYTNTFS